MTPVATLIAEALQGTEFEGRCFLVGGCVRDELMGRSQSDDLDLVVEGDALAVAQFLWEQRIAQFPPTTYPRFGTAMVTVDGRRVEFASARRESYEATSRKPSVERATLLEDAQRRDFTVNALMQDLFTGQVIDLTGSGIADLKEKVLRTPLDPVKTFFDDPLRMMRAVRFRWKLGFEYAPGLADALREEAHRLSVVSGERIREELSKMLLLPTAPEAMDDLMTLGLFDVFAPEFRPMVGCEQGGYHHLDVWNHTLLALKNAGSDDLLLSLSVLLHDVGKPLTQTRDDEGRIRFFGHETVGAELARTVLQRLKFSNTDIETVALLVKNHMRLNSMNSMSLSAARRIVRDLGDDVGRWLELIEADAGALKPGVKVLNLTDVRAKLTVVQAETPKEVLVSPLSGREIIEMTGLEPGEVVGRLKNALSEDVVEGRLAPGDKPGAVDRLWHHWRNAGD